MINTKENSSKGNERKERLQELIKYHQPTFDHFKIKNPLFVGTMAYKPVGKNELHISFFPSQLKKEQDIYTEFVTRDYEPETKERILYKWNYNKFYDEEYESVDIEGSADKRYLIPISELQPLSTSQVIEFSEFDEIMDPDEDAPLDQMTVRDLAAILLKSPVSRKKWLNQIIVKENGNKTANSTNRS